MMKVYPFPSWEGRQVWLKEVVSRIESQIQDMRDTHFFELNTRLVILILALHPSLRSSTMCTYLSRVLPEIKYFREFKAL